MFRAVISPIFGSIKLCLQLRFQANGQQHRGCIIPQAVNTV